MRPQGEGNEQDIEGRAGGRGSVRSHQLAEGEHAARKKGRRSKIRYVHIFEKGDTWEIERDRGKGERARDKNKTRESKQNSERKTKRGVGRILLA